VANTHWEKTERGTRSQVADAVEKTKKRTAKQEKSDAKEAVPKEVVEALKGILDGGKAADLALFGRMLADLPEKNVDAACQVAHSIQRTRSTRWKWTTTRPWMT